MKASSVGTTPPKISLVTQRGDFVSRIGKTGFELEGKIKRQQKRFEQRVINTSTTQLLPKMSRDAPLKAEKDYSELLDEQFPQIDVLGKVCIYAGTVVAIG